MSQSDGPGPRDGEPDDRQGGTGGRTPGGSSGSGDPTDAFGASAMPGPAGRGPRGPRGTARSPGGRFGPTIAIVVAVLVAIAWAAQVWTEFLWFDSLGYTSVLTTRLGTQSALFLVAGGVTGVLVWYSLWIAYRKRPIYAPSSPEQANLDRYRAALDPVRRLVFIGVPVVLGAFAGAAAVPQWQTVLLFLNRQPFGVTDAQFDMDVGFYVFTLPFLELIVSFATLALGLAVLGALMTHYVYGGVTLQGEGERTTTAARIHLAILFAVLIAVRAASYWLERFSLTTNEHQRITGMTYTDVNAVLPTRGVLAIAALLCAAFFLSTIWTRTWRLPIVGLVGLVVVALLVGGAYPALVQTLRVEPSQSVLEAPYIDRAIDATLLAYNVEDTEYSTYQAETEATQGQLREDAASVPGIRIVDPSVVSPTFRQLQGVRNYYQFPEALDVDRYEVDGQLVDTVIALREIRLSGIPEAQRNWVNDHTVYTHGFGVVAAYGNQRSPDGEPVFYERNIPPVGALGDYEPRVYFGEYSPEYSIVGAPEGTPPQELDFPDSTQDSGETRNTYAGDGGVSVGGFARQLAYSLKYRELEILLADGVNAESRILDHREPRERVERVAPWLTLDGNPYPAVVDGRIQWVVDGYTTSNRYPYSSLQALDDVTSDSVVAAAGNVQSIGGGEVNYIRNSVKATVDAYDGTVRLYAWDEEDPVLKAWSQAFDNTVRPLSEISGELMSHLRYPEDLFKVQREVLASYHVESPEAFFSGQDFWRVSEDPTAPSEIDTEVDMPPYYLSIQMPDQEEPAFSLTTNFVPRGEERENLVGYMAVDAEAGTQAGERREGFGQIQVLELPRDQTVTGPAQFQNDVESSNETSEAFTQTLSQFLTLNRQADSDVLLGNLLTLPVGGGLLYVEPIYVQASGDTAYPLQRLTVVAFGNDLAWSDTLDGALDALFGGESGVTAPDEGTGVEEPIDATDPSTQPGDGTTPPEDTGGETSAPPDGEGEPEPQPEPTGDLAVALQDIQTAYDEGQQALREGDLVAYGEAQERLEAAIQRAVQLSPEGGSVQIDPGTDGAEQTETP